MTSKSDIHYGRHGGRITAWQPTELGELRRTTCGCVAGNGLWYVVPIDRLHIPCSLCGQLPRDDGPTTNQPENHQPKGKRKLT